MRIDFADIIVEAPTRDGLASPFVPGALVGIATEAPLHLMA